LAGEEGGEVGDGTGESEGAEGCRRVVGVELAWAVLELEPATGV